MKLRLQVAIITLITMNIAHAEAPAVPVIVELFSSEGCSDCPPAEKVLAELPTMKLGTGVTIITLNEHVDYFDTTAWHDAFASPFFTARQKDYARLLGSDVYTPQMIVDGTSVFVGSDRAKAIESIRTVAAVGKIPLALEARVVAGGDGHAQLVIHLGDNAVSNATATVYVAVVEDNLHSDVSGGENGGRRLEHPAIVRSIRNAAKLDLRKPIAGTAKADLDLPEKADAAHTHIVAFVQNDSTGRIISAAQIDWPSKVR